MRSWIRLHRDDDVGVCVAAGGLAAGTTVDGLPIVAPIAYGHKVALRDLPAGAPVHKYGHVIGVTTAPIARGAHVHVHNVVMPGADDLQGDDVAHVTAADTAGVRSTFDGYARPDGSVGTRNVLVVAGTVNCSASVVKAVCQRVQHLVATRDDLDGIVPVTHSQGCAQAIGGAGHRTLNRTLAGWIFHPNTVGAVVIGLGCEGTHLHTILAERAGRRQDLPLTSFGIQETGGTAAAIARGVAAVEAMVASLPVQRRTQLPVSALRLALNCGGSDGFSGLTANPVLGAASDLIVAHGGGVTLAEIPECHGCEDLLAARAVDDAVRQRLAATFAWWADYATSHHVALNDNLAPGNIAGGITTILEKSLGAVAKAGSSPLTDVVGYAQPLHAAGFSLMNTPGFDPASVTGLVAGGAQVVAFTTGRGSVFGTALAPTIKIATSSELARRMAGDIDFDAGPALASGDGAALGRQLYDLVLDVASGRPTASEALGIGWEEFVPWAVGETL